MTWALSHLHLHRRCPDVKLESREKNQHQKKYSWRKLTGGSRTCSQRSYQWKVRYVHHSETNTYCRVSGPPVRVFGPGMETSRDTVCTGKYLHDKYFWETHLHKDPILSLIFPNGRVLNIVILLFCTFRQHSPPVLFSLFSGKLPSNPFSWRVSSPTVATVLQ